MADFIGEPSNIPNLEEEPEIGIWKLFVDGSLRYTGFRVSTVLIAWRSIK